SIYDNEKYGESSEPSALPWDQINPTNFATVQDLSGTVRMLEQKHQLRMSGSPEYRFLLEDIDLAKVRENEVSVSLNERTLKEERDSNQRKNRERINEGLRIRGLPLWMAGEPQPKIDFDFIRDESLNVMTDFIALKRSAGSQ